MASQVGDWYRFVMADCVNTPQTHRMHKRIAAAGLWFLVGWFVGDALGYVLGVGDALGLIYGIAAAFVFAGDPLGVIWSKREAVGDRSTELGEGTTESSAEAA